MIDATDEEEALAHFIENYRIDILAILTHKRNFFQELFTYSMTKKMAYHLKVPILAFQNDLKKKQGDNEVAVSEVIN